MISTSSRWTGNDIGNSNCRSSGGAAVDADVFKTPQPKEFPLEGYATVVVDNSNR